MTSLPALRIVLAVQLNKPNATFSSDKSLFQSPYVKWPANLLKAL